MTTVAYIRPTCKVWTATPFREFWTKWRDPFLYASSQWETALQCKVVSYWQSASTDWSLKWSCYQEVQLCSYLGFYSDLPWYAIKWVYLRDHESITAYCYIWKIQERFCGKVRNPLFSKRHRSFANRIRNWQSVNQHFFCWTDGLISMAIWEIKQ